MASRVLSTDSVPGEAEAKRGRAWDLAAGITCLAAFTGALVLAHAHQAPQLGVEQDFVGDYDTQAHNLLAGRPYTYQHNPPGYSLLLALVSRLTPDFFTAGKLMAATATALLGWCTYALLKELFDRRLALYTILLVLIAVLPWSYLAATDVIGGLVMTVAIWVLLRQRHPGPASCLLAGIAAGASYLVRSNAITLLPGLAIAIWLCRQPSEGLPAFIRRLALLGSGFLIVTLPWFVTNTRAHGSPLASTAYLQIAAHFFEPGGDAHATSLGLAAEHFHSLGDVLRADPVRLAKRYLEDVLIRNPEALALQGLGFPGYLFAGVGALLLLAETTKRRLAYVIVLAMAYALLGLVGFYLRYYFFVLPAAFLCVVWAIFSWAGAVTSRRLRPTVMASIVFGSIAFSLAYASATHIQWDLAHEPRYLVPFADSLRRRSMPNDLVVEFRPYLAYLAGLPDTFALARNAADYLDSARAMHARYLVYTAEDESIWAPLGSFRDPRTVPDGFRLLYRYDPAGLLVYEVEPASH